MKIKLFLFLILSTIFSSFIYSHGFFASTSIKRADTIWPLEQIYKNPQKQKLWVSSFDRESCSIVSQDVIRVAKGQTNCFVRITFDAHKSNDILCTPSQELFLLKQFRFVPACQLRVGDELFSAYQGIANIKSIELIEKPLTVYALEVDLHHNFFVGNYAILAHNMFLPVLTSLGVSLGSGAAIGGATGGCFGPITFVGGVALGGAVGIAVKIFSDKVRSKYLLHFDIDKIARQLKGGILYEDNEDSQAPGKPTEDDGFVPKKNWDGKKVRHRRGYGWPDSKGNVWIPTGPKGHGCPHWDVQKPNGEYDNVVPGGRIRGKK